MGIFGYLDLIESKESSPDVWQIPPKKSCIYTGDMTGVIERENLVMKCKMYFRSKRSSTP
jgi:hypothetical protein